MQQITEHEIWSALNKIGESKALVMDGFTFKIFKASSSITKKDLIAAMLEFFEDNYMYVAVNCAIVTLIPKSSEEKSMKYMKPIACCATV